MELNRETLLRAYPALPQQVDARMERTLAQLQWTAAHTPQRRPVRRLCFALVLTLCLLIAALGMAAGAHFGVFDFMAGWFGQSGVLPQAAELVETPEALLDLPHATLALEEAVYDGGVLRVVYSVTPKAGFTTAEAIAADGIASDGCDRLTVNGVEIVMPGGSYATHTEADDRALCYLHIELAGIAPEGSFTVGLPLAGEAATKQALVFPIQATYVPRAPVTVQTNSVTATLSGATLSPVRAYVQLHVARTPSATDDAYQAALGDWEDALLVDGNGRVLSTLEALEPIAVQNGEWIDWHYTFLPTDAPEVYFAPTLITPQNEWLPDMAHAIRIR